MTHIIAALALTFSIGAFAGQCPLDMRKIDAALAQNPSLSESDLARVKQLRAEGEAQHNSGKHGESVRTLGEAKQILGID
ncbi:MAG: hypothetical protein JSU95_12540 [Betaproteobacteria bacterium]|nr:MAG: hypothetical protein JSU95_12540 [Betaproteobacteria bacterium]